jgi:hypothetical protein
MFTAFDYIYRDAGNFKAFGTVALEGELDEAGQELIRAQLSSGEFFIAEQIGVPPLYRDLHRWSGGPTSDDHCWHEFLGFRVLSEREKGTEAIDAREFVARFAAVDDWHEGLSPHFWIV